MIWGILLLEVLMKIINTMVSVYFENCIKIRSEIAKLENLFAPQFSPVTVLPIPNQAPPEIYRATLQSIGGHSQLSFSNSSAILNTIYDNGYEADFKKCVDNLQEKVKCIYKFLNTLNIRILYIGLTTTMLLKNDEYTLEEINSLNQKMNIIKSDVPLYDYSNRMAFVVKDDYFVNLSFANVRTNNLFVDNVPPNFNLPDNAEQKIEITVDINDKHAFFLHNTNTTYCSKENAYNEIVDLSSYTINKINGLISQGEISFNE